MIQVSTILSDCTSGEISKDSRLLGLTKGQVAKVLQLKDLSLVAEFNFNEEVTSFTFSEDNLKFFVTNK